MRLAVSCAMNQNRSMQIHDLFLKRGIEISSFGTNPVIKLPGETMDSPNMYVFGQTYKEIYEDLCMKNERYYRESGLLYLLERNMSVKEKPENFFQQKGGFDLVLTCEESVFKAIFDYHSNSPGLSDGHCFMVNFEIKDTPSDAITGANEALEFVELVKEHLEDGLEQAIMTALQSYFERKDVMLLFTVMNL